MIRTECSVLQQNNQYTCTQQSGVAYSEHTPGVHVHVCVRESLCAREAITRNRHEH